MIDTILWYIKDFINFTLHDSVIWVYVAMPFIYCIFHKMITGIVKDVVKKSTEPQTNLERVAAIFKDKN